MPKDTITSPTAKTKRQKYRVDTTTFCQLWSKQLKAEAKLADKDKDQSWRAFVLAVVNAMGKLNTSYEYPPHLDMTVENCQYTFGSERCYNKAKSIQTKLMKENGKAPALPEGWSTRRGISTDRRTIDWGDIGELFD